MVGWIITVKDMRNNNKGIIRRRPNGNSRNVFPLLTGLVIMGRGRQILGERLFLLASVKS